MDEPLRPDLGRILPKPALHRIAGATPTFAKALSVPAMPKDADFFVDVERRSALDPGDTGFGLAQASAVAAKIAAVFVAADERLRNALHRPEPDRVQTIFEPD
ncbi:MAG: hypothetical protein JNK15_20325 [Planctomycetes bacterium]|nr:hypothetical protein [Planctomycetota bacterium]